MRGAEHMSLAELYICIYNELRFKIYLQFIDSTDCSMLRILAICLHLNA